MHLGVTVKEQQLDLLIQLQEIDLQLNQLKEEQKNLPEKLKVAQQPLDAARQTLTDAKNALELLNKERKEKEQALQTAEEKITKLKSRLTELKTNKEYQAHLLEIEAANAEKGKTEEFLLVAMEQVDAVKKDLVGKEAAAKAEEAKFNAEKNLMDERLNQLSEGVKKLEKEWGTVAEKIDKRHLDEYKRLSAVRKGLAVAPLKGNICTGCHFSLPPQLIAEVKMRERILTCTYCHRMLYVKP